MEDDETNTDELKELYKQQKFEIMKNQGMIINNGKQKIEAKSCRPEKWR